ncbi:MAG: diacylglycerol kinase family lipid kinase [Clostridiales bacterium]|jgi:diacylglycerol kinase (ATP)|nr:diacylglycerol kinase family lipid kinase [Clostridiales bacterium]
MRIKAIINPVSGRKVIQNNAKKVLNKMTCEGAECDIYYTTEKGDGFKEACKLKKDEYDLVMAVGGDGTLHEVVNGVISSGCDIPLSIMPAGTVNDFGYFLHIPYTVSSYCKMIKDFYVREIDVGKVGNEYFLNVFAIGLLTEVPHKVPQEQKNIFGKLAYYATGTIEVPANIFSSNLLEIEHDDETVIEDAFLLIVTNSSSVGGFRKLAPMASIADGFLDVCIVRKISWDILLPLLFSFMKGEHINSPNVSYFQTSKISIKEFNESKDTVFDMDGEMSGVLPAIVEVCPKALKILISEQT